MMIWLGWPVLHQGGGFGTCSWKVPLLAGSPGPGAVLRTVTVAMPPTAVSYEQTIHRASGCKAASSASTEKAAETGIRRTSYVCWSRWPGRSRVARPRATGGGPWPTRARRESCGHDDAAVATVTMKIYPRTHSGLIDSSTYE